MRKLILALIIVSVIYISPASAELNVNRFVTDSGLIVLHVQRSNLPMLRVSLLIKSGAADEPPARAGLASMTASLLTEGTKSRTSEQISRDVEFLGASLGAGAAREFSTLGLSVLKKDIPKGFELMSDVLLNPKFAKDELKRKKDLALASFKQQQVSPSYLATKALLSGIYGEHPYGRLASGTEEGVASITRRDVRKFYAKHYLPNNSIMAVVGDIELSELKLLIDKYLSSWKQKELKRDTFSFPKSLTPSVIKVDRDLTQANIFLGHLGIKRSDPDYYPVVIMNYILGGGGFSSRLMDKVRDDMGLAYGIRSTFSANARTGIFYVNVQTKSESANIVIKEIINQMERIIDELVSEDEINDAKSYLTGSFPRRIDTMGKLARFLPQVELHGLGLDYPDKYLGYIKAVTREDIQRVAEKYLHPDSYVLVVVGKQGEINLTK